MTTDKIEIVFSFDTTGSMYPCLTQVRRKIKSTVTRLMSEIPGIRIGIIAHGDYCDERTTYVTSKLELSTDADAICQFVETTQPTGGGDAPECYELVLHEAQSFQWTADASKSLVVIGDEVPHPASYTPRNIDWQTEVTALAGMGVQVYGVQALNRRHATSFYKTIAERTGGFHISLDQFSYITDLFLAVCYNQASDDKLLFAYEKELIGQGRMNRSLHKMFDTMLKREPVAEYTAADLKAVPPGRFQVLDVDKDISIKTFVVENGLTFKVGRGFYEFTKTETIQGYKEIILLDRKTGDFFEGEYARELLSLPIGETARIRPTSLEKYMVFVQSTSANRKLVGGTKFLYEVDDWDRHESE